MEENSIIEALKFMILGMGVVFSFLVIMIFMLKGQTSLINRYFSKKTEQNKTKHSPTSNMLDPTKVAAIIGAIQHHKNLKG